MKEGVDGVQLSGVERVAAVVPTLWADIRAIVQNGTDEGPDKRSGNTLYRDPALSCALQVLVQPVAAATCVL